MTDKLENKYRILALKKASIVLNAMADSFKDEYSKQETKSLAWAVSWAVMELEKQNTKGEIKCEKK